MKKKNISRAFRAAFPLTLPVMAGYIILGIGFGIMLWDKGFGILWALAMSIFIYAGSMQYLAVGLLSAGASIISAVIITLTVNARHLAYSFSMLEKYRGTGKAKPVLIFGLTDETFSVVSTSPPPPDVDKKLFYLFITLLNQLYWVTGSVIGSAAGTLFKFDSTGVNFAMTALFIVIMIEQIKKKENRIPALSGILISLACLAVFGTDMFIIPSMILISVSLLIIKKISENKKAGS